MKIVHDCYWCSCKTMVLVFFRLYLFGLVVGASVNQQLADDLLSKKSRSLRPVENPKDQLTVNVVGALYQIVDVWWSDSKMQWDPKRYNGTTEMYLPSSEVWIPELYLYHSVQGSTPITVTEWAVQVMYTGEIRIFFPFTARALCPINVKYFPFDKQRCNFTFGSWSYKLESVKFSVQSEDVFLDDFYDNQEWILLSSKMQSGLALYNTTHHKGIVLKLRDTFSGHVRGRTPRICLVD